MVAGPGQPYAVSALHGRGSGDLLDAVLAALPDAPPDRDDDPGGPRRVALLGKPNVGKSSLLNRLAGSERSVVDQVAGTTIDPVDELVELGGTTWRFVDTAGSAAASREASGSEYYAVLRTEAALEKAEVAVVLVDASQPLTEQDLRIISLVEESGRALVLALNKWDLIDEERRYYLDRELERDLVRVQWAPRVNVSARTGRHVDRLVPAWRRRWRAGRRGCRRGGSTRSSASWSRPRHRRCAAASSRRSSSSRRRRPSPRRSCVFASGFPRGVVPTVHRAQAPRGVRLRRVAGRGQRPGAREAPEVLTCNASERSRVGLG